MKQLKAVVLEKKGSMVTILAADGSFQRVKYRKPVEVGAEIEISGPRQRQPLWQIMASIAAIFLFTLIGSMSWNSYQATTAVAMISLDINPRLQLTIDQKGRVLQFEALNSDAERVLEGLDLKGEPWNLALENIIGQSATLNYLNMNHNWVLVGYSPIKDRKETPQGVTPDDIAQRIESAAQAEGLDPNIAVYQLNAEEQTQAEEQGLTLGEFALMNTAKDVGIQAEASTLKSTDDRINLLEQPQVQKQMAKENRIKGITNYRGDQPEVKIPGKRPDDQHGNSVAGPQEEFKEESKQGNKKQGQLEEHETGDQDKPEDQKLLGEQEGKKDQEKLKSNNEENNDHSEIPQFDLHREVENE